MQQERPKIEGAIQAVFRREDFAVRRMPEDHAGGKWSLRYRGTSGQGGRLDVDLNFMYRVPFWPVTTMDSRTLGSWRATGISMADLHEVAAGKLSALLSRCKARDLFDSRLILAMDDLDIQRLRLAFVVYGAMHRKDWRTVSAADVNVDIAELINQLAPHFVLARYEGKRKRWHTQRFSSRPVDKGCQQCCRSLRPSEHFWTCCWTTGKSMRRSLRPTPTSNSAYRPSRCSNGRP